MKMRLSKRKKWIFIEIWKEDWFQDLSTEHKLFVIYIQTVARPTGLWKPNDKSIKKALGFLVDLNEAFNAINEDGAEERVLILKNKEWFIKSLHGDMSYIEFQHGKLNPGSKFHKAIIDELTANGIDYFYNAPIPKNLPEWNSLEEAEAFYEKYDQKKAVKQAIKERQLHNLKMKSAKKLINSYKPRRTLIKNQAKIPDDLKMPKDQIEKVFVNKTLQKAEMEKTPYDRMHNNGILDNLKMKYRDLDILHELEKFSKHLVDNEQSKKDLRTLFDQFGEWCKRKVE
jgi:hypothetical protein